MMPYDNISILKESFKYDSRIYTGNRKLIIATLRPLTYKDLSDDALIELLTKWRIENYDAYPSQFEVTVERTRRWLAKYVLANPNKLLFLLEDLRGEKVGHMGIANYDEEKHRVEMDNIVRGNKEGGEKGIITNSLYDLITWTFINFPITSVFLRVFKDNEQAIRLYQRLKFVETSLIPLKKVFENNETKFIETSNDQKCDRFYSFMELDKFTHFTNYEVKYGE